MSPPKKQNKPKVVVPQKNKVRYERVKKHWNDQFLFTISSFVACTEFPYNNTLLYLPCLAPRFSYIKVCINMSPRNNKFFIFLLKA